jgi:hypothetical protein
MNAKRRDVVAAALCVGLFAGVYRPLVCICDWFNAWWHAPMAVTEWKAVAAEG